MRKIPLMIVLFVSGVLFSILAIVGRSTIYQNYELDLTKQPVMSLVFEGMGDHVYPWQIITGETKSSTNEEVAQILAAAETGTTASTAGEQTTAEAGDVLKDAIAGPAGMAASDATSGETAQASEASTKESAAVSEAEQKKKDAQAEAKRIKDLEASNDTYVHSDTMPEDVNSPVMDAVDYGNVDRRFMSSEDTVYNQDTAGLFAGNGDYYRFRQVDDVYFSDALFIGDSRTAGLHDYGDIKDKTYFLAKESLSVFNMFDQTLPYHSPDGSQSEISVIELLSKKQFRKIYFSVGVNELGMPDTLAYYQKYREAVAVIHQLQPDAIIYIQGIMHVAKSKSSKDRVFNNTNIVQRNRAISTLANGYNIFYIDMNPAVCDENGDLIAAETYDGVHLKGASYELWHQFLLSHAIVRTGDDYLGTGAEDEQAAAVTEASAASASTTAQTTANTATTSAQ